MIPWFIVNLIAALVSPFGLDVYVKARSNRHGADRIHFMRRLPGAPRPRKLAPYRGGPIEAGDILRQPHG